MLGEGEREAIVLAEQHRPDVLLLMDEGKGRREAQRRNLRITGTLGVLNDAASRGWVDLPSAFERLQQTTFRASSSLLQSLLDRDAKRKRGS
jgi:predicted nucleic acid-binding protein